MLKYCHKYAESTLHDPNNHIYSDFWLAFPSRHLISLN